jgi:hypothetical protein
MRGMSVGFELLRGKQGQSQELEGIWITAGTKNEGNLAFVKQYWLPGFQLGHPCSNTRFVHLSRPSPPLTHTSGMASDPNTSAAQRVLLREHALSAAARQPVVAWPCARVLRQATGEGHGERET